MTASTPNWSNVHDAGTCNFIARFMVVFGFVSSIFDFPTFGVLRMIFHAAPPLFRTGWFVESLLTELLVALVVRTRRPFFRSRPGRSCSGRRSC